VHPEDPQDNHKNKRLAILLRDSAQFPFFSFSFFLGKDVHDGTWGAGVLDVDFNRDKDTATVRGAMDAKALAENLREQMKRAVEIVPPKKDKDGGEAKDKEGGGGKNRNVGGSGCSCKAAAAGIVGGCWWEKAEGQRMEYQGPYGYGYGGGVYWEPMHLHAPQLFSDENPNACSVM